MTRVEFTVSESYYINTTKPKQISRDSNILFHSLLNMFAVQVHISRGYTKDQFQP